MCTNTDIVQVTNNTILPTVVINGGFAIDCVTSSGTLDGTGSSEGNNYTYQWSNPTGELAGQTNLLLDVNAPDTYTLQVTNTETGCVNEAFEVVGENLSDLPIPTFIDNSPTCFGASNGSLVLDTIIGGEAPYLFSFEGQSFTNSSIFNNLTAGDYSIIVEDAIGCQDEFSFTITDGNDIGLDLGENQLIDFGDSTEIAATVDIPWSLIDTLIWEEEESLSCFDCIETTVTPFQTTTYSAQAIDENGCTSEDFVTIVVNRELNIFVPTAFSPNNDGINDYLIVFAGEEVVQVNTFFIYDRWGEKVYEFYDFPANDSNYGWDGFKDLQLMNSQVFVYHVEVLLIDGRTETVKGDFTLVK
jgi:gliding motility-associated-like protein